MGYVSFPITSNYEDVVSLVLRCRQPLRPLQSLYRDQASTLDLAQAKRPTSLFVVGGLEVPQGKGDSL